MPSWFNNSVAARSQETGNFCDADRFDAEKSAESLARLDYCIMMCILIANHDSVLCVGWTKRVEQNPDDFYILPRFEPEVTVADLACALAVETTTY
jgi:hypothetical protein